MPGNDWVYLGLSVLTSFTELYMYCTWRLVCVGMHMSHMLTRVLCVCTDTGNSSSVFGSRSRYIFIAYNCRGTRVYGRIGTRVKLRALRIMKSGCGNGG